MPMSPDRRGRSPMGRSGSGGRGRGAPFPGSGSGGGYKVLCVSSLHPKTSDDGIRDTLYREYKKYGDISVRVVQEPDERVAYVYFRNFEDARDAKHSKSRIILFDKPALVEAVCESRPVERERERDPYPPQRSSRQRSISPGAPGYHYQSRYRSRSPLPIEHHHHQPHPPQHHRYGGRHERYHHPRDDYHHAPHHHHQGPPHHHQHHHHPRGDYRDGPRGGGMGRGGYGGGYGDRGGGGYHSMKRDSSKKDKFPNYLNHIPPEDDPAATRTLFTGNLELNITEEEMKRIFGKYGNLVDIDIKRPPPGTGNAYAFIRYENLDMAHKAKLELSGQYIGKFQCKIGYGKVNATPKVWVGGLGTWTTVSLLEREFDRFGAIQKIEFQRGDPHASIYYETLEAAQAAVQEMRGFPLGGPDKRIRIDYSDLDQPGGNSGAASGAGPSRDYGGRGGGGGGRYMGGGYQGGRDTGRSRYDDGGRRRSDDGDGGFSPPSGDGNLGGAKTISDLTKGTPRVWEGGLIVKNSLYPTKLFQVEGSERIAEHLRDDQDQTNLKITRRLRLDHGKLEEVTRRIDSSSSFAIFLGVPSSNTSMQADTHDMQSRALRNLILYLKQKEAAGVIDPGLNGLLYCFPPCPYSMDLLKREAPDLEVEETQDDFLVVLVVCNN